MIRVTLLLLVSSIFITINANDIIKGSGASFPYSVYQKWLKAYHKETGVRIDYIKKGSSKGIKDAQTRAVDFAGTDKPLPPKFLKKYRLYQFPAVIGAIIIGYNLPGVKNLKLSRAAIVEIVMGNVNYWDDKIITDSNKNLKLPHKKLTFIHRADGSGTTYNFTYYLSKISKKWRREFGAKKSLNWPGNHHIGGKANSGVATLLKQTKYSVGYIDYTDARNNSISMANIQNREGKFIIPTLESFQIATAEAPLEAKKDFYSIIADPKGSGSYPIVTASFILLPLEHREMNKRITSFYKWCYTSGQNIAKNSGFIPLPKSLVDKVISYWHQKNIQ